MRVDSRRVTSITIYLDFQNTITITATVSSGPSTNADSKLTRFGTLLVRESIGHSSFHPTYTPDLRLAARHQATRVFIEALLGTATRELRRLQKRWRPNRPLLPILDTHRYLCTCLNKSSMMA